MAFTNFAKLTPEKKLVWAREVLQAARDMMFIKKFMGDGANNCIQRISELTKTERGEQVIMHLLADLVEDGVVGDDEREGNEEEMMSYRDIIQIDLISHGVRQKGKLAEQKTVIRFREWARDRLAYWLANRIDQLAFLTLSGITYDNANDGAPRTSSAFSTLSFAADVRPPSAKRHLRVDASTGLEPGDTSLVEAQDVLTYNHIVNINTYAKAHYVKPLMSGGKEFYVMFVRPEGLAQLKKDPDYQRAVITGLPRSMQNPFFSGGIVTTDGIVFHEHRLVYNTTGLSAPNLWGSAGDAHGSRALLCGAQALGFAEIGNPEWSEKMFQYDSSPGVNIDRMFGLLKPEFFSIYDKTVEDFGVIAVDHTIDPEVI